MLTDRKGNRFDESDTLAFTPPAWWDERADTYKGMRARHVQVKRVVTHGNPPTVELKSRDAVMAGYLRSMAPRYFPTDWLTLVD